MIWRFVVLTEADILRALPALRKYARRLGRRIDAEDLIQDTLTHAWAKRARYHGGNARAWLFTVMHNVYVSKMRRISVKPPVVNAYSPADDSSFVNAPAFFRLIVRDVERELQSMPEGMREAVMLAAVSTDGYHGMAARLNMNLGTFRSRLSRGRQRLRIKFTSAPVY
jgi:RNA polymerase sigma-70 factor (ECF subfamily)